jgi:serine/threonine protein kinase
MGIVVQATHLQLHQSVAMKFLLPEVLANQQAVQRFLREAQAATKPTAPAAQQRTPPTKAHADDGVLDTRN